jgi:hypothetical protein
MFVTALHISDFDIKEIEQQRANTIILHPKNEIYFAGMRNKSFELLQNRIPNDRDADGPRRWRDWSAD